MVSLISQSPDRKEGVILLYGIRKRHPDRSGGIYSSSRPKGLRNFAIYTLTFDFLSLLSKIMVLKDSR